MQETIWTYIVVQNRALHRDGKSLHSSHAEYLQVVMLGQDRRLALSKP